MRNFNNMKRSFLSQLKISLVVILFLGITIFSAFQSRNILAGPRITIVRPDAEKSVDNALVEVVGIVEHANNVTLNGRKIFLDEKNQFVEKLLVAEGYNRLKVEATDKFGRTKQKTIEIVYNPTDKTARADTRFDTADSP